MSGYSSSPVQAPALAAVASGSSVSFASTPAKGDLLIAIVGNITNGTVPTSVSDGTNTWTLLASSARSTTCRVDVYGFIATASQPKTVTATLAGASFVVQLEEWSGNQQGIASIIDGSAGASNGSGTTGSGANVTTSGAYSQFSLLLTATVTAAAVTAPSDPSGWSALDGPSGSIKLLTAYENPGSTGTFSPSVSWTTSRAWAQVTLALLALQQLSGTATGSLSIQAGSVAGTPAVSSGATASLSIFAAGTSVPFEGDMDAVPQAATFPFIPGQSQTELSAGATGSLSITAGPVSGVPAAVGTANGFLSISASATDGPTTGHQANLSISASATGTLGFTQSGITGALTVLATASGSPAMGQSGATGSLTIATQPVAVAATANGLLSISTNTPIGSASVPGILNAQLSILASAASTETNARGNLTITASAGTTSVATTGTANGLLTIGTQAQAVNLAGAQLSIGTFLYSGPIAPAVLTITASSAGGTVFILPTPGSVGIRIQRRYSVGIGVGV